MTSPSSSGRRRLRVKRHCVGESGDGSCSATDSMVHVPAGESSWRDWASLSFGPAWLIADRVLAADVAQYVRFRAVCTAWRGCTADPRGDALDRRFHPRRWVMLPDIVTRGKRPRYRYSRFMNIATGEHIRMTIRGLDGRGGRIYIACTFVGLLVLVNKRTGGVFVLNPITGARSDLPPLGALLSSHTRDFVLPRSPEAAPLSAEVAGDSAVVINFDGHQRMGIARPGDEHWTKVKCEHRIRGPVLSFASDVYCVTADRTPLVLETSPPNPPTLVKSANHPADLMNGYISSMLA